MTRTTRRPLTAAALAVLAASALAACAPRTDTASAMPALEIAPPDTARDTPEHAAFFGAAATLCIGTHAGQILERAGRAYGGTARTWIDVRECDAEQVRMRFVTEAGWNEILILRRRAGQLTLESFGVGNPIFGRNVNYVLVPTVGGTETTQRFVGDARSLAVVPALRNQVVTLQVIAGERLALDRTDADARSAQLVVAYDLSRRSTLPGPTDVSRGPVQLEPLRPRSPPPVIRP